MCGHGQTQIWTFLFFFYFNELFLNFNTIFSLLKILRAFCFCAFSIPKSNLSLKKIHVKNKDGEKEKKSLLSFLEALA